MEVHISPTDSETLRVDKSELARGGFAFFLFIDRKHSLRSLDSETAIVLSGIYCEKCSDRAKGLVSCAPTIRKRRSRMFNMENQQ